MIQAVGNATTGTLALFGLPGHWEIIIIVLAILLLFGGRKLPELARGLGRGLREFRDELKGAKKDLEGDESDQQNPYEQHDKPKDQPPPAS